MRLFMPLIQNASRLAFLGTRTMSSSGKLTTVEVNDKTGIAVLTMNRPPINALNMQFLTELETILGQLEDNRSRGLILTTALKTVFSAGVDLFEVYKPDKDQLRKYWGTLQNIWIKLYGSSYPTAVAISGHAPAGGCLLSLSCEYRVMCPNFTIGFNETQLGIFPPIWCVQSMQNIIPKRIAEDALISGRMFSTDEALKVGLVDESATDKADAVAKCEAFLLKFQKISPIARGLTKQSVRSKDVQELVENKDADLDEYVTFLMRPEVQEGLGIYMERLKKK